MWCVIEFLGKPVLSRALTTLAQSIEESSPQISSTFSRQSIYGV
jgi:hypothetical protein